MSYYTEVTSEPSLISYWRFGEPNSIVSVGGTAVDVKGINNGSYAAPQTSSSSLLLTDPDFSVNFPASSGVKVVNSASLNVTSALTLECWFYADSFPLSYNFLMGKRDTTISGYDLYIKSDASVSMFIRGGGSAPEYVTAAGVVSVGGAYHIIGTYDDASDTVRIIVNGVKRYENLAATGVLSTNTALFSIGARSNDGVSFPSSASFDGRIDEPAIYGAALSEARATAHWIAGTAAPSALTLEVPAVPFWG